MLRSTANEPPPSFDTGFRPISASPKGAIVLVREESDQLFYVYTGVARGLMINPILFFKKTRLLERNVVIFQDRERAFYQKGVSPALNTFEAFLAWQAAFHERMPHVRRLFCLGTSMGGYAALLFGHLLGAEEVWAFSPSTALGRRRRAQMSDVVIPRERSNLATLLGTPNGSHTKYNVFYSRDLRRDELAAKRIARCDGVTMCPQPEGGHNIVNVLLERDQLDTLLPEPS
jgi:hypothetical protein